MALVVHELVERLAAQRDRRAARAGAKEAAQLELPEGEAVFVAERLTWLADKPVTFVRMIHPPSHRIVTEL